MRSLAFTLVSLLALPVTYAQEKADRYDFRMSPQYLGLPETERTKLETVHRDLILLTGALERYADDHGASAPKSLADLTPLYLRELPRDPFATKESAGEQKIEPYVASQGGFGYRYRQGLKRSWIVASVGLPEFPYLAERGNVGLYLPKGLWISGQQFTPIPD